MMKINKIIKQAKNGDKQAFNELITFYEQDLYKIARARLNEEDVYDAIQETIITIYQSLNKLSKISSFKSWMIKILINKCNDLYRKKEKLNDVSYDIFENEDYLNKTIQDDSNLEFNSLMNLLDYDERIIVILYYIEGYKSREIAETLKIKHNTVRSKLHRAKFKLREYVKEEK